MAEKALTIRQIELGVEKIQDECQERLIAYLTPILKEEFRKICKKNPRLKQVIWGNGGFLFCFEPEGVGRDHMWWDYIPGTMGTGAWNTPKYSRRFIELVAFVSDLTGGLNEELVREV